jgi:hypothetical protein
MPRSARTRISSASDAVDEDPARVGLQQPEDQPQDRRLARAAGAEEDLRVARLEREAHVAEDHLVVEPEAHLVEDDDRPPVGEGFVEQRRPRILLLPRHVSTRARS